MKSKMIATVGFMAILGACASLKISRRPAAESSRVSESPSHMTFAGVKTLLSIQSQKMTLSHKPFLVGDGLGFLKEDTRYSSLFTHYTLVKNSLSLQTSSVKRPRAILYGDTAQLIVTFNSDPSFAGGLSLEIAEFDSVSNKIFYREIIFKDEFPLEIRNRLKASMLSDDEDLLNDQLLTKSDIAFEDQRLAVTIPNPQKCMQCHALSVSNSDRSRYIWDSYHTWPGLYGVKDDKLSDEELVSLAAFKKMAVSGHDRYKYLEGNDRDLYPYDVGEVQSGPIEKRANLLLTKLLAARQAMSLASWIQAGLSADQQRQFESEHICAQYLSFRSPLSEALTGFNMESVMSLDRQSVTASPMTDDFNAGGLTFYGHSNMTSLVLQELTFKLENPKRLFDLFQRNRSNFDTYLGLSSESKEFLNLHYSSPPVMDLRRKILKCNL